MAIQLFSLRNVPDDEAHDIRELLDAQQLDYYETGAGNWGISSPAIWLKNDADQPRARELIDAYQRQRSIDQREHYAQLKQRGQQKTLWATFMEHPLRFVTYLAIVGAVAYFSIKPFLNLGK
ncbi:MAG: hypothetical protein GXP17_04710 [Gammaproteobacteria bacterium]|nr:hypothetical protein [Gammaproteobacteria bacterium]